MNDRNDPQRDRLLLQAGRDHRLSPMALRVLLVLAVQYYNATSGLACPSQDTLAEELTIDPDRPVAVASVSHALRKLVECGYLTAEGAPCAYRLGPVDAPPA